MSPRYITYTLHWVSTSAENGSHNINIYKYNISISIYVIGSSRSKSIWQMIAAGQPECRIQSRSTHTNLFIYYYYCIVYTGCSNVLLIIPVILKIYLIFYYLNLRLTRSATMWQVYVNWTVHLNSDNSTTVKIFTLIVYVSTYTYLV